MGLDVCNISFGYGKELSLHSMNLMVHPGQIIAVAGPNGCGKTTFLKNIACILKPRSGVVRLDSEDVAVLAPKDRARRVSYMAQQGTRPDYVSVLDTIMMGRHPYIRFRMSDKDKKLAQEIINLLELESFLERKITTLSGGEMQKVLLAKALMQEPRLLMLDEPTNHLDPRNQVDTIALVRSLTLKLDLITLIVLHDINLALRFSDEIVLLKKGWVTCQKKAAEIEESDLATLYDTSVKILSQGGLRIAVFGV